MVNLPEIPSSKPLGFLFFGVMLYIGSSYLNILKDDSATYGVLLGIGLIAIGASAQIINWLFYWRNK